MPILCVGSVALDSVETPFGRADRVLGGSAVYFSAAATVFNPVQLVGVIGDDYPVDDLGFLAERGADLGGIERASGKSFFWAGRYHYDLNTRDTLDTQLGVFADFQPKIPDGFRDARFVFLGRPTLYGVVAGGKPGAAKALQLLRNEVDVVMRQVGITALEQLGPDFVTLDPELPTRNYPR